MSKLKILVADDDPDILTLHRLALSERYDVVTARDGHEALRLFEEVHPRLVITDLNMPGMNGQVLTDRIREHETLGQTPVIVLTGTTRDTDLPSGFWRIGTKADLFLEKPVSPDELMAAVQRTLVSSMNTTPLPPGKGYYEVRPGREQTDTG